MNSNNNSTSKSGGVTFVGLLTIVFITLKLCGVIRWSWWWVLSPMWIWTVIVLVLMIEAFAFGLTINKKRNKVRL